MEGKQVYTISRKALSEVAEAAQWYESEVEGLGFKFLAAFESAVSDVLRNPSAYTKVSPQSNVRRILIKPYLYKIFYVEQAGGIHVIALLHAHRSNRFVRRRLR